MDITHNNEGDGCKHGKVWDDQSPVDNKWIAGNSVAMFKESIANHTNQRKVYYRLSIGKCVCKLQYDEQEHLLFNNSMNRAVLL